MKMTNLENLVPYKSREYCKISACEIQMELDMHKKGTPEYESIKKTCQDSCKRTAWEFHDWLQKQGYSIVKENK